MSDVPRKCDRKDCKNDGRYKVALKLRCDERSMPAEGDTGLVVCSVHRSFLVVDDVLTDAGWEQIVAGFKLAGKAIPARHLTRLLFQKIKKGE
jgi:hypothetical protein